MQEHKISKVSKRVQKEKVSRFRTSFFRYGALILALYILAITLSYRVAWVDERVTVDVPKTIQYKELHSVIESLQDRSRFLFFIRRDNTFLFPKKHITDTLLDAFPRIASLDIKKDRKNIHYGVEERSAQYIACLKSTSAEEIVISPCWYMDTVGMLFDEAPVFSTGVYTTFLLEEKPPHIPYRPFDLELLHQLYSFRSLFETQYQGTIESVAITERDIVISVLSLFGETVPTGAQILLDKLELTGEGGAYAVLNRLNLAQNKGPLLEKLRARPDDFLYLDMRFPDKFYYKFYE